jgi:Uncharacterised Sugar-binding Domain./S-layer homology domain.
MRNKQFRQLTSTVLLLLLTITSLNLGQLRVAYGADETLDVVQTQLTGENVVDLSQAGNVDWLHMKGNGVNDVTSIKKAGSNAITFNLQGETGVEGKLDRGGDATYLSYSWNDGMTGYETGTDDTGFMVMFPVDRSPGIYENIGYDVEAATQSQASSVVFGIGMWQAEVDVNIYANGALYETKKVSAGSSAQVYKYQIEVPAGVAVKLEVRQTKTLSQYGNMSFSGMAVASEGAQEIALDVKQNQVTGEDALDLSQTGDVDWLHMKGNGVNNVTAVKKEGSNAISFSLYGETGIEGKLNRGSDANYLSYSWNDGMAGYETGTNDTGFLILFPQNRNAGTYTNAGYNVEITPQPQDSTVVFGIGMWQAEVDVNIYANNALYETRKVSAASSAQVFKYQIKVPAGIALKLEIRQTKTLARDGNMSFSGMAVSSREVADKSGLQNAYKQVKDIMQGLYTDESWQSFVTARDMAKTILDKADATQAEANGALSSLSAAQAALVRKATNIMIDYTGTVTGEYELGSPGDQQDRYQTFTPQENFDMELVQFKLKKIASTPSDLIVRLYLTTEAGLPTGSPLAETTVREKLVADGDFTTAKLAYSLAKDTRYAIVLSQTELNRDQYRWLVMAKNVETNSEYFGKSVSGNFQQEAWLGTGILRIIKNTSVDRSALELRVEELGQYSSRLYTIPSWTALQNELQQAHAVLNDVDAAQADMDAALDRLQAAYDQLELNTDAANLSRQVDAISRAVVKGYTESSVNVLNDALDAVKALDVHASDDEKIKAYSNVMNALDNLKEAGKYQYETHGQMTAAFGFEGDKNASLAFTDGSYQIGGSRGMQSGPIAPKQMVTFGVTDTSDIKWYNGEGYLPVFVSEYTKDNVRYKIETFANKHSVAGKDYVVDYSRVTAVNDSNETRLLPLVSQNLTALNEAARNAYVAEAGQTVVREYAIEADKYEYFDGSKPSYSSLTREQIAEQGSFADNYSEMKTYWNSRLSNLVDIELPNHELVNAFKAGYIDTMIIKDNTYLHVGENGYDRLFSHDTIGIMVQLIQSGDFLYAKDYLKSIPLTGGINIETGSVDPDQYWDANWKLPWAYAVYLSKTGDASIFQESMTADDGSVGTVFEKRVKAGARSIESDRTGEGIMKKTYAIDSEGYWTIDNYSALTGLTAYEYISRELYRINQDEYYLHEAEWAKAQYDDLLAKFTARLQQTIAEKGLNYIPASVVQSNNENRMQDSRDANWASMYLFGRWLWDGYLYGAEQPEDNINLTMLDDTYSYGINRRLDEHTTDSPYNFGGYPHGFYSSAYNAGYGSAALRGEEYRDIGIKAYEFMIEKSMSGPFSWWEGIAYPAANSPWANTSDSLNAQNTPGGGGSAQHMWGQAVNSKVLIDSLIAERIFDQNQKDEVIVGRGIPKEWVLEATRSQPVVAKVRNYPVMQGGRAGYAIVRNGNKLEVTLDVQLEQAGIDTSSASFSIQLPSMVNNIAGVSAGVVNNEKGIVTVPLNTKKLIITLSDLPNETWSGGNGGNEGNHGNDGGGAGHEDGNSGTEGNTGTENQTKLTDIQNHWAGKDIQAAVSLGIVKGYSDGTFRPNTNVSRSEFAVLLGRALKFPTDSSSLSFGDADNIPTWAKSYIAHAVQSGIISGYGDQTFRPDGKITRLELVAMLARALDLKSSGNGKAPFADGDQISEWGQSYVTAAYEAGLIQGKADNRFAPEDQATRAEAVTLILRAIRYLESK